VTNDLTRWSAARMADSLARREISAVELTQAHLDRIAAVDGSVHSYLHVDETGVLAQARAVDDARARNEDLHVMAGVPIAVKDVVATEGLPTTCGSRILSGWIPPYDATLVTKLKAAGMPILGKTNMDEFAMGSSTEHSRLWPQPQPVGPRAHPRRLRRRLVARCWRPSRPRWRSAPTPAARSASRPR
jgi:aspartyl-tRNA(Asn)/glutamyl-tRNA(Gln) amidotransferase subunit A